ncbi:MAG: cysteine desulfurase [Chitinophagales bacterium]|nr:cysteine desulfurase [Chitinophagales bacterium]MDW8419870.1 cysteine desulfurase [Chitinophagales bacterium]
MLDRKADFPILHQQVNGKPLVYFDNAATTQKPIAVINAIREYYEQYNSNIHRGAHHLANIATSRYEEARSIVARHLNASEREINFVRGTTEAVNLVAQAYGRKFLKPGDEIIVSEMEHHSNIVPWQMLCSQTGAVLRAIPVTDTGELDYDAYRNLLNEKTKIVSVAHTSNALGTVHPLQAIIRDAHSAGAVVFVDAAQALPHTRVDVHELDCDFLGFSGHKVYAATGIGVLYGKEHLLEAMDPYMGGGEMIRNVSFAGTTYNDLPFKFEAGTPNIEGAISLGAAIQYITAIGIENIQNHEQELLRYATARISETEGIKIYGTAARKAPVISFTVNDIHPYDLGVLLNEQGVAIRTGHHCCQPLMSRYGLEGTCRASFALYNTKEEIDRFAGALARAVAVLA